MLKNKKQGFTLIELLVVIAIIGILSSVVLASLNSARQKSRDAKRVADIKQVQLAMELYFDSCGTYPNALATATANGCTAPTTLGSFIASIPADPTGGNYQYAGLASVAGATCTSYHLGTKAAGYEGTLPSNDLNYNSVAATKCTGGGAGFDGTATGVFDARP